MSVTVSYGPLSRLRAWQSHRQITRLLRQHGRGDITLGQMIRRTSREEVFEAQGNGQTLEARRRLGPEAALRCRAELDVLDEAATRMSEGSTRVTRVVWSRPSDGLLVSEIPDAPRLAAALGQDQIMRRHAIAGAGRWLSRYASPSVVEDRFGGGYWIRHFTGAAATLPDQDDRDRLAGLLDEMRRARSRAGRGTITRARCHGDFRAAHFWMSDGIVWGSRLQPDGCGAVLRDVARFLVELSLHAPSDTLAGRDDVEAMSRGLGILPVTELQGLLPYFLAVECAGQLLRTNPRTSGIRDLIDRHLTT